ncbi:MAG: DUF4397 domain-containing protein [Pseudomonadales bacterium]|nr:DUF4397 domain-containing protein [Pseudomonadales bacterium]
MIRPRTLAAAFMAVTFLAACGGNNSNSPAPAPDPAPPPPPPATSSLEVLHASPDAPAVDVLAGGSVVLSNVPYKTGSGFLTVQEGTLAVEVRAITPSGSVTVIGPANLPIAGDERITVIAVGETATLEPLVLTAPEAGPAAGNVRLRVVHAAPNAPAVDVFATAPGADLASAAPLGTFAFGEDLGPVEVPAATYQVRVTLAGDASTVVFDSGEVPLTAGADLVIAAVQNTGPGTAPISLVALDGTGSLEILDATTPSALRVVHASADAPDVDIIANDDFAAPAVPALAFPDVTGYLLLPPSTLNVKVVPAGAATPVVIDADLELEAGVEQTVLAVGPLADIEPLVLVDDNRRIATEARIRLVHASPSAGNVDIYVTDALTSIDDVEPAFAGVPFKADTGYVGLAPGSYAVTVTPAGSKVPAIGPVSLDLEAAGIYTAVARDEFGGGLPPGLILLDDLAP